MSLREERGTREEEKQNAMEQNKGHFVLLRAFVSEIISSSQPPVTGQPKSEPWFVSHQPIHRALLLQCPAGARGSTQLKLHNLQ